MSFVEQEDVFQAVEPVLRGLFEEFAEGKPVTPEVPAHSLCRRACGNTAPTSRTCATRSRWPDVTAHFAGSGFKVFAGQIAADPKVEVWAIPAPTGGNRAFCDRMNAWAQGEGQPGLGYIFFRDDGEGAGPIAKNIGAERTEAIRKQLGARATATRSSSSAGGRTSSSPLPARRARRSAATSNLLDEDRFAFCWIVDFPMYEWNEEEKKIDFSHNPFSMPNYDHDAFLALDPDDQETILGINAFQYDIVCNGVELSSGAIRNHKPEIMKKAFAIAGYGEDVLETKFGGMLRALQIGAPPHGGIAPGIDRIVMLLCGEDNLREVTLFPMNQRAEDLMMGAPSEVTAQQLRELHIRLNLPE